MPAKRCVFALVAFGKGSLTHLMHLVAVEDGGQIPEDWLTKELTDKTHTEIPQNGRVLNIAEITDPGVIRVVGNDGGRLKGSANYAMLHGYCVVYIDLTK